MALTKQQKIELGKQYKKNFADAKNVVIIRQTGIGVNDINEVRKGLFEAQGEYKVVKKRVLLKSLEGEDVEAITLDVLGGSVAILCAYEDEYAPLKVMNTSVKKLQDDKKREGASFEYVGGRFDGKWQDGGYVSELANIPSREELISKLLYLVKYPLQGFAMAMSEIAKKGEGQDMKVGDLAVGKTVEAAPAKEEKKVEEKTEEVAEEKAPEAVDEKKETEEKAE